MNIWDNLKYFKINEKWGDPEKVNGILLLTLDALRGEIGSRFVIHNAYAQGGHATKSQHYLGNAVDFHIHKVDFRKAVNSVIFCLKDMQMSDRVGLGIYPDWNNPGFHLDVRGTMARWGRIKDEYVSINEAMRQI